MTHFTKFEKSSYVRSPTPLFVIFLVPSLVWSTCHDVELIFLIHIPWKKSFLLNYNTHFIFRLTTTIKRLVSSHDIVDSPILCSLIFSEKIDQNALSIPFIKTKCLPFFWSLSRVPFDHTNTQKNFEDMFSYSLECASMCVLPKNLNNDLFHVSDSWQWQCVKWTFWSRNRDHSSANIACSHLFT